MRWWQKQQQDVLLLFPIKEKYSDLFSLESREEKRSSFPSKRAWLLLEVLTAPEGGETYAAREKSWFRNPGLNAS